MNLVSFLYINHTSSLTTCAALNVVLSTEEDGERNEIADWDNESSDEEETVQSDDGEDDEIDTGNYSLDDALLMWKSKRTKKDYAWQEAPVDGMSNGDNFVFYREWGWEMCKVYPYKDCTREQKECWKSMKKPVHCFVSSDDNYQILELGIEGISYLSKEKFTELLNGEDEKDLGIEADKSWCVVRLE